VLREAREERRKAVRAAAAHEAVVLRRFREDDVRVSVATDVHHDDVGVVIESERGADAVAAECLVPRPDLDARPALGHRFSFVGRRGGPHDAGRRTRG
jgi:hypothetical protein